MGEIIRFGSKRAGDRTKLLTRFSETADLVREADYFARVRGSELVEASHVQEAMENRIFRSDRIAEKIRELIEEGTLLVDTQGAKIGQVNGLAVVDLGDYAFGRPIRVTASIGLGSEGLINIEREARLSGRTHDKAVLIITGFLRNRYGQKRPLTLSASLAFEQTYNGIEGDSASAAEIYALISSLAEVPLRQDIAITGSVNQWGQIQAIGGVNEKVEGLLRCLPDGGPDGTTRRLHPPEQRAEPDPPQRRAAGHRRRRVPHLPDPHDRRGSRTAHRLQSRLPRRGRHHPLAGRAASEQHDGSTRRAFAGLHEARMIPPAAPAREPPAPPRLPDDEP